MAWLSVTTFMSSVASRVQEVRDMMERARIRRLQPHFILSFFQAALKHLGGTMLRREPGRFELTHVPAAIRNLAISSTPFARDGHAGMPHHIASVILFYASSMSDWVTGQITTVDGGMYV